MLFSELINFARKAQLEFACSHCPNDENFVDIEISKVVVDNRLVESGSLFVCISGEKNDGHNFASQAIESGAVALLAEKGKLENPQVPTLFVDDTSSALQKIAHAKRMDFEGKVIAITGTAGKTSVKEMLFQVLSSKGKTAKNHLNYNTQLGVSISILSAKGDEDFWILEAGISHEHDMDEIATIIRPDIALILNAGLGHAEGLPRGAAYYKSKLFQYLKDSWSVAIASADYADLVKESRKIFSSALYFSTQGKTVPYRAAYMNMNAEGKGIFRLYADGENFDIEAPLRSAYGAENVIAITSIALLCGMKQEEIQEAFRNTSLPVQRFEVHQFIEDNKNVTVIDDSYNANPLSFSRMVEAANEYTISTEQNPTSRPLICLVGAMYELGDKSEKEHEKLAKFIAEMKASYVFYTGPYRENFQFGLESVKGKHKFELLTGEENFAETLKELDLQEAVFLVKGSRSNKLEVYVKELINYYS